MGDSAFFGPIGYSCRQVHRIYPDAVCVVYDWGFTEAEAAHLAAQPNTRVVDWKSQIALVQSFKVSTSQAMAFAWHAHGPRNVFNLRWKAQVTAKMKKEILMAEKIHCLLDFAHRWDDPFVYLDGDAVLVHPIDELFDGTFHIGLTLRRESEYGATRRRGAFPVNAGVQFYGGTGAIHRAFLLHWSNLTNQLLLKNQLLAEQSALHEVLSQGGGGLAHTHNATGSIFCGSHEVILRTLPCEMYNYNWIEEGVDPTRNKILHFKGARHSEAQFANLIATALGQNSDRPEPGS